MIHIPTGPVPKNIARTGTFVLGVLSLFSSIFAPQYADPLQKVGGVLAALGLTLGKADQ